jgi:hypothetical protein
VDKDQLTKKQKEWLETSKKIGPGAMTKSEKQLLEKLYAEMLPQEQQALYEYIQANFGPKDQEAKDQEAEPDDPIARMQNRVWSEPSEKLIKSFGKFQSVKPPFSDKES